ncbi:MAG: c-type cytochrome [Bacteroidota bacterium]
MKIITRFITRLTLLTLILSTKLTAQSVEEGEKLFTANCVSCHAINDKVVGPALKDVHKRRDEKWLLSWIKNSQKMIKSGDATAVALYKEYNESVMTSFENLNDNQIKSIIEYVKAESDKPAATATAASSTPTGTTMDAPAAETSSTMRGKINWMLVVIVVLLFLVIGLVLEILNMVGEIRGKEVINWSAINAGMCIAFLVVGMVAAFWELVVHGKLSVYTVDAASEHGAEYDNMLWVTFIITGIMFVLTQILLFWYAFRYKQSSKRKALFFPDNHRLEFIWTIIPAIVLTVLVVRGLKVWNDIMNVEKTAAMNVEVYGYQFGWNARYTGADGKLGAHDFRAIGVVNALGVDPYKDEKAKDDIVSNELYLPVGKQVTLKFRAKDVIHSAFLPHFRVQMNVVPGLPTQFTFTPTLTTAEMRNKKQNPKFDYILLCNKICGSAHYRMKMKVVVVSQSEYDKWLATQTKLVDMSTPVAADNNSQAGLQVTKKIASN